MPEIEISDDQQTFLDGLVGELTEEHVGEYGAVRYRDALQYLIDHYQGAVEGAAELDEGSSESDADADASSSEPPSDEDRLEAMMNLLDTHDDKWEESDGEDGNYVVTLPEGDTETVRTRDDIRALLFKHYR